MKILKSTHVKIRLAALIIIIAGLPVIFSSIDHPDLNSLDAYALGTCCFEPASMCVPKNDLVHEPIPDAYYSETGLCSSDG